VWDGCATEEMGTAPAGVPVDIDVFLYRPNAARIDRYAWASQSTHDNTEGFDYTVPDGAEGIYRIIYAWPDGIPGCDGADVEPMAAAWLVL
jgi:hypothetical protein